jgi:hypothetical protein
LEAGCPKVVRRGRCREHQSAFDAERAHRRIYKDPRWPRTRAKAIRLAGGRCQALEHGRRCPATEELHGHHDYPGGVARMLLDGVDPFDVACVVVLCGRHHGQVEAWERAERRRNPAIRR